MYLCSSNLYIKKCICVSAFHIEELFLSSLFQKLIFLFSISEFNNNSLKHTVLIPPLLNIFLEFYHTNCHFQTLQYSFYHPYPSNNPWRSVFSVSSVLNAMNVTGSNFQVPVTSFIQNFFSELLPFPKCWNSSIHPTPPPDSTETHLN